MLNLGLGRRHPCFRVALAWLFIPLLPLPVLAEPTKEPSAEPEAGKRRKSAPSSPRQMQVAQATPSALKAPAPGQGPGDLSPLPAAQTAQPAALPASSAQPGAAQVTPGAASDASAAAPQQGAAALPSASQSDNPVPEGYDSAVITEELPAQDAFAANPEKPQAEGQLGEMVVTAARRETTAQKYAGSATELTQQDLDRQGIRSVRDVAKVTPSVTIATQEANVEVYIRGVGTNNNTEIGDPTVATHIDGVYIPRPRGVGAMLFDMERLEISRGPQGTLRGRNAVAGTINVITAKPVLGEWLGDATLQLGNYSQRQARGMFNVPIGDHVALRVAGFGETHDPYYNNGGPIHTIIPSESGDTLAYRATLLVKPSDSVKITLAHDFVQEKGTGYSGANFYPALTHGILPQEVPDPRSVIYRGPQPSQALQHWGVRGNLHVDFGPVLLEYLSSYRQLGFSQVSAGNAGVAYPGERPQDYNLDDWGTSYWQTGSKSVVQELRLFAPDSARLRWTAGGFLFLERQKAFLGSTTDNSTGYLGNEFNMPSVRNHSIAGYIDAIFDILSTWRATAGARVSTDAKARDGIGYSYSATGLTSPVRFGTEGFRFKAFDRTDYTAGDGPPNSDFLNGIASFGARDTLKQALMQDGVMIDQSRLLEQHGSYHATFFDFRLGTDVDVTKNNLLYAQFATGHKSGGFNDTILVDGTAVSPTYRPEALYSTEVGSKNKFFSGRLIANLTGFWYHYVDQQFRTIKEIVPPGQAGKAGAASTVIFNAANSRVLGLEAQLAAQLVAGLRLDVGASFLDARFTRGVVADTRLGWDPKDQTLTDLRGNRLPRAPMLTVNYGLSQRLRTSFGKFTWSINAQTRSVQYMTVFNGDGRDARGNVNPNLSDKVPSYTRFDVNFGYTTTNGRLRLDAFVLNVTNATYMTSLINTPSLNLRFFNAPRQIGARVTVTM